MIFVNNTAVTDPANGLLKELGLGEEHLSTKLKVLSAANANPGPKDQWKKEASLIAWRC
jgi:hypothetical protein